MGTSLKDNSILNQEFKIRAMKKMHRNQQNGKKVAIRGVNT